MQKKARERGERLLKNFVYKKIFLKKNIILYNRGILIFNERNMITETKKKMRGEDILVDLNREKNKMLWKKIHTVLAKIKEEGKKD